VSIDVAVIPAAGRGMRMRPATRVVPKALLTVVDRPAIQYAVEEAARAGAKEAVVVVDLDAGHLVAQHFSLDGALPGLEVRPGRDVLESLGSGSREGAVSVMCLRELNDEFLSRYGVVIPDSDVVDGYLDLAGAVEKPGVAAAPSRYGLVGRYVFTPEVFSILEKTLPGVGGEIQLTDAIHELGQRGRLRGFVAGEDLLDVGTPQGLLRASYELGLDRFGPELFG